MEDDRGKKVMQKLLAAAGQGGGFVEYHWDDPTQPDDEIRKVSHAVELGSQGSDGGGLRTGSVPGPGQQFRPAPPCHHGG
ncbi:hypothetical protein [Candidatus Synechococcus spongiarum]|uniref:hypothetical protein n=1 Tax=Candidatus Synechococcus spongiarum TaxID=431041 RepID=UPI000943B771